MELQKSQVTKIHIEGVRGLDPINVFTENFELGKGRIVIECYGSAWASFWPAMGASIEDFFISCGDGYLVSNLSYGKRLKKHENVYLTKIVNAVRDAFKQLKESD